MPYKDPAAKRAHDREYGRRYYASNLERLREKHRTYAKSQPEKAAAHQAAWRSRNLERSRQDSREYLRNRRRADVQYDRAVHYKQAYGITIEEFDAMAAAQGGVCSICGLPPSGAGRNGKVLHVDHDHSTGKIRSLLCAKCNTGIGCLRDDPALLRAAAAYIESHVNADFPGAITAAGGVPEVIR